MFFSHLQENGRLNKNIHSLQNHDNFNIAVFVITYVHLQTEPVCLTFS